MDNLRRSFLMVSSDNKTYTSNSNTDFYVKLQEPLRNVVQVDVVSAVLNYTVPNITTGANSFVLKDLVNTPYSPSVDAPRSITFADLIQVLFTAPFTANTSGSTITVKTTAGSMVPADRVLTASTTQLQEWLGLESTDLLPTLGTVADSTTPQLTWTFPLMPTAASTTGELLQVTETATINITNYNVVSTTYTIPQSLYTPSTLKEKLRDLLPAGFMVRLVDEALVIEQSFDTLITPIVETQHNLTVASSTLRTILGLTTTDTTPVLAASDGVLRWTFPRVVKLPKAHPFLLLQSDELGNNISNAAGDISFFRMLVASRSTADQDYFIDQSTRVQPYLDAPRSLSLIDIKVLLPNKTVAPSGGSVNLLLEIVQTI